VDHSTAGAKEVGRLVGKGTDRGMAELIATRLQGIIQDFLIARVRPIR